MILMHRYLATTWVFLTKALLIFPVRFSKPREGAASAPELTGSSTPVPEPWRPVRGQAALPGVVSYRISGQLVSLIFEALGKTVGP